MRDEKNALYLFFLYFCKQTGDGGGEDALTTRVLGGFIFAARFPLFFSFSWCSASLWLKAIARLSSSSSCNSAAVFLGGT